MVKALLEQGHMQVPSSASPANSGLVRMLDGFSG